VGVVLGLWVMCVSALAGSMRVCVWHIDARARVALCAVGGLVGMGRGSRGLGRALLCDVFLREREKAGGGYVVGSNR